MAVLIVAAVVAGITEGAAILVVVRVAVDVASDTVESNFVPLAVAPTSAGTALIIAAACAVVTLGSHLLIARESAQLAGGVLKNARARVLRAFTNANWTTQSQQRLGSLQETVGSLSARSALLAQLISNGVANAIMLAMFMAVGLAVNPIGMMVVALAGVVVFASVRPLTTRTRRSGTVFTRAESELAEDVSRFAASAMELRTFGVGSTATTEVETASDEVATKQRNVRFVSALGSTIFRDVAVLLLIGSVGVLTLLDRDAVGSASAVVVLVVRSLASAHAVNAMIQSMSENGPAVELLMERIDELESKPSESGEQAVDRVESVEFCDVRYAYPDGVIALDDLSLTITRGERVGIIGQSGGGKSTLLQLLLRLRTPTSGNVKVNGVDYRNIAESSLPELVAFVPQEPTLFEGSVAENIGFFREFSPDEILRAAADANVSEEIERLPLGFDTRLGPGGSGLSGGQKQRVAIARALIGRPQVLVLDEPSSALDPRSEILLREALDGLGPDTTVVIVAHREAALESCDRIVTIDGGRVTSDRSLRNPVQP